MQKNLYQVQQSTAKYCLSFRTLLDRNMKTGCHSTSFFFRTHSFHGIPGDSPEILWKLSVYEKFITKEFRQKAGILRCERMENIRFRKNMMAQRSFCHQEE